MRNQARIEQERDRARDQTVRNMEEDIERYFELGDEEAEGKDEIVQKFKRGIYNL